MEKLIRELIGKIENLSDELTGSRNELEDVKRTLVLQKSVFNLDEVCLFTGLSKSHIYKLTCVNAIPHYKQAKHLYFDKVEIEAWLKSYKVK